MCLVEKPNVYKSSIWMYEWQKHLVSQSVWLKGLLKEMPFHYPNIDSLSVLNKENL